MSHQVSKLPWIEKDGIRNIFSILGDEIRFVGGCVRNSLMNREVIDIDMATTYLPEEVTNILKSHNIKVVPTGIKFGTVTAVFKDCTIEITTLRKDLECYGRHAKVEYTKNWQEDSTRRDFTINAMYMDQDGKIYDFHQGIKDIKDHTIKFVGNPIERCKEDYLRILRFFRFFAWYGKENIDQASLQACKELAKNITRLSGERVQKEMFKLLLASNPVKALLLMQESEVLKYVLPEGLKFSALEKLISIEKNNGFETCHIRRLAIILRTISLTEKEVLQIVNDWKMSNDDKKKLLSNSIPKIAINKDIRNNDFIAALRLLGKEGFIDLLLLKWAEDQLAGDNEVVEYKKLLRKTNNIEIPQLPITGKDIIKHLNIAPGREVGELLDRAENWWKQNGYSASREQILEFLKGSVASRS